MICNSFVALPLDVINIFGVETILIYTALLLKKKVVVYSPKIETLLDISRLDADVFYS